MYFYDDQVLWFNNYHDPVWHSFYRLYIYHHYVYENLFFKAKNKLNK